MLGDSRGFSLVELLVASLVGIMLLIATGALFRPAMDVSYMLTQRAAMQQSARFALDRVSHELGLAGNGLPGGGIQLPSGSGSIACRLACDFSTCYLSNPTLAASRLYGIIPGDGRGPVVNGISTDTITVVYRDPASSLDQYPLTWMDSSGLLIRFDSRTSPAYNDPQTGLTQGDLLLVCNANGCAAAVVDFVWDYGYVFITLGDPLAFNQYYAAYGTVRSIYDPSLETRAFRLLMVTYYIDPSDPTALRLMRQVSAHSPQVAALDVENLQISYDIFETSASVSVTSNLPDAGGVPNQIRKINVSIGVRAPLESLSGRGYERLNLTTSVSPRNLRFRDRY